MGARGDRVSEIAQGTGRRAEVEVCVHEGDLHNQEGSLAVWNQVHAVEEEQLVMTQAGSHVVVQDTADLLTPCPRDGVGGLGGHHGLVHGGITDRRGVQGGALLDGVGDQAVEEDERDLAVQVDLLDVALDHDGAPLAQQALHLAHGGLALTRVNGRVAADVAHAGGHRGLDDELAEGREARADLVLGAKGYRSGSSVSLKVQNHKMLYYGSNFN